MNAQQQQDETPRQSRTLAGHVAIVTGASRGIGRAAALAFAAEGAAVALAARDADALAANVAEITAAGGRALAVPTDVADEDSVAQLFARTEAAFGPVTILVNAAGAVANRPFAEMDTATWDSVLNTNLRGTFLCCRPAPASSGRRRGDRQLLLALRRAKGREVSRPERLCRLEVWRCRAE